MKGYAIPLLLILSLIVGVLVFRGEAKDEAGLDKMAPAMENVRKHVPHHSAISFRGQQFQQIRFLLAPDILLHYEGQDDTALVVYPPTDSVMQTYVQQHAIIWQQADADFHYALIHQRN